MRTHTAGSCDVADVPAEASLARARSGVVTGEAGRREAWAVARAVGRDLYRYTEYD